MALFTCDNANLTLEQLLRQAICNDGMGGVCVNVCGAGGGGFPPAVTRTPNFVENSTPGAAATTAGVHSFTIKFFGAGNELNGIAVNDGDIMTYSGDLHNVLAALPYTVGAVGAKVQIQYVQP